MHLFKEERMEFKRRIRENFIVQTFSRIDRMRQSNEEKHETSVIGAIETFPDDRSKLSLLYSNNSKGRDHKEKKEIRTNYLTQVLVSQQKSS